MCNIWNEERSRDKNEMWIRKKDTSFNPQNISPLFSHILHPTVNICIMTKKLIHSFYTFHLNAPSPTASLQRWWEKGLYPNSIVSEKAISTHKLAHSSMGVRSTRWLSIMTKPECWLRCTLSSAHAIPGDDTYSNMINPLE